RERAAVFRSGLHDQDRRVVQPRAARPAAGDDHPLPGWAALRGPRRRPGPRAGAGSGAGDPHRPLALRVYAEPGCAGRAGDRRRSDAPQRGRRGLQPARHRARGRRGRALGARLPHPDRATTPPRPARRTTTGFLGPIAFLTRRSRRVASVARGRGGSEIILGVLSVHSPRPPRLRAVPIYNPRTRVATTSRMNPAPTSQKGSTPIRTCTAPMWMRIRRPPT